MQNQSAVQHFHCILYHAHLVVGIESIYQYCGAVILITSVLILFGYYLGRCQKFRTSDGCSNQLVYIGLSQDGLPPTHMVEHMYCRQTQLCTYTHITHTTRAHTHKVKRCIWGDGYV